MDVKRLSKDALKGSRLPLLEDLWKAEVKTVTACGGQHRRAALDSLHKKLHREVSKMQEGVSNLKDEVAEGKRAQGDVQVEMKEKEEELMGGKGKLKLMPLWGVAVYDLGAHCKVQKTSKLELIGHKFISSREMP